MPVLFFVVIVIMGSFAMLLPAIIYVLGNMGVSTGLSTPVIAAYSLAQFLAGPQWGRLSDRLGRKKVLSTALFLGSLSYLAMAFFSSSLLTLVACMACAGFCAGALAVVFAAVADMTSQKNRTKGMGMIGAAIGLSFVLGTAVGGSISGATAETASIVSPAVVSAVLCAMGCLMVLAFFTETHALEIRPAEAGRNEQSPQPGRFAAFQKVAKHPSLLKLCFLVLAFTFCLSLMEPVVPKYILVHFGWGPLEMRNLFIFIGCVLILVQGGLIGPLARRFGEQNLVRAGLALMGAGLFLMAVLPVPTVLYIALMLTSVGTALFNASSLSLASHEADNHERGAVMGVAQSMQALGRSFGPLVTGVMFDVDAALPFWVGCAIVVGLLIVFQRLTRQFHRDNLAAKIN